MEQIPKPRISAGRYILFIGCLALAILWALFGDRLLHTPAGERFSKCLDKCLDGLPLSWKLFVVLILPVLVCLTALWFSLIGIVRDYRRRRKQIELEYRKKLEDLAGRQ
jgi:hypothetical protein